jgi:uncharacterized protein YabN with tetrapyrrole methylase and pyrophosphatase domain
MEKLPDDYEVYIVTAAGSSQEKVTKCALFELDRQMELSNLTSVYVPLLEKKLYGIGSFLSCGGSSQNLEVLTDVRGIRNKLMKA